MKQGRVEAEMAQMLQEMAQNRQATRDPASYYHRPAMTDSRHSLACRTLSPGTLLALPPSL